MGADGSKFYKNVPHNILLIKQGFSGNDMVTITIYLLLCLSVLTPTNYYLFTSDIARPNPFLPYLQLNSCGAFNVYPEAEPEAWQWPQ